MVVDFFHWPKLGDFRFDAEFWPDPEAMIAELHELGIELMVSVWPQISVDSENFAALRRANYLVSAERGTDIQMSFGGPSMFLDATHPGAREAVWALCRSNYWDKGVRIFWLDEAEPEYGVYDFDNYRYHVGPNVQVGNLYPQLLSRAFYDGMTQSGQVDVVNLVRSGWAGSQRYGALVWSGDILSTFEDLRTQITAGIHMGAAGIPWFTTDIGGFHGGDPDDEGFRELLIRWFQFGTFSPIMRIHGDRRPQTPVTAADGSSRILTGAGNEVWSFGDDASPILEKHLLFRELLRPYSRLLMAEAHESGQPVMRGLFHEFPADPEAWIAKDVYLYGPDLLVAPVTEAGAREREVYLPVGATWTDLRSGARHAGGQTIVAPAPLESAPVFARDGSLAELVGRL
jgi:alpha-D-xyloside xylohydrolase